MDKTAPIADFMTSMPHTVGSEQTITFAQQLMEKHGVRHLPVLHGGELYGIVSDRDLGMIAGLNEVNPDITTVEEAMTQEAYTVSKDTPLFAVLEEMLEHKYGCLRKVSAASIPSVSSRVASVSTPVKSTTIHAD